MYTNLLVRNVEKDSSQEFRLHAMQLICLTTWDFSQIDESRGQCVYVLSFTCILWRFFHQDTSETATARLARPVQNSPSFYHWHPNSGRSERGASECCDELSIDQVSFRRDGMEGDEAAPGSGLDGGDEFGFDGCADVIDLAAITCTCALLRLCSRLVTFHFALLNSRSRVRACTS